MRHGEFLPAASGVGRTKTRRIEKLLPYRTRQHFGEKRWHGVTKQSLDGIWSASENEPIRECLQTAEFLRGKPARRVTDEPK